MQRVRCLSMHEEMAYAAQEPSVREPQPSAGSRRQGPTSWQSASG